MDTYIGVTQVSRSLGMEYGGGHVLQDLVDKKAVTLEAHAYGTDSHPKTHIKTDITLQDLNQAIMVCPRSGHQRYACTNSSDATLYTHLGALLPNYENIIYSGNGELSPLANDPDFDTIGIGTRIFLAGAQGYIIGEGTFHDPKDGMGSLMVKGDLKKMNSKYLRAATLTNYGSSIFLGIGIPIPILNEQIAKKTAIRDEKITIPIYDFSVSSRSRPIVKEISYAELKKGKVAIDGTTSKCSPISSIPLAREIMGELKSLIEKGEFLLGEPIERLSTEKSVRTMKHEIIRVGKHMEKPLLCEATDSLKVIAKEMISKSLNNAIVVDNEDNLIGMISSLDLTKGLLNDKSKISEVMRTNILTATTTEAVETIARRMTHHQISTMPVLDEQNKVVGIVSLENLSKLLGRHKGLGISLQAKFERR